MRFQSMSFGAMGATGAVVVAMSVLMTAFSQTPAVVGAALPGTISAIDSMPGQDALARVAADCALACDACSSHCLQQIVEGAAAGGDRAKAHLESQRNCQDCASICFALASVAGRNGPFATILAGAAAEACRRCAEQCETMPDDAHMKHCAEVCRACEKACRDAAAAPPAPGKGHGDHR